MTTGGLTEDGRGWMGTMGEGRRERRHRVILGRPWIVTSDSGGDGDGKKMRHS